MPGESDGGAGNDKKNVDNKNNFMDLSLGGQLEEGDDIFNASIGNGIGAKAASAATCP